VSFRSAGAIVEEVVGIERAVAQEMEDAAVVFIAAAAAGEHDQPAAGAAVLGVVHVGPDTKLLRGVDGRVE
jgi:hypothetical protein